MEVVRVVEGGDRVTSCIDSEGNVVVSTVYKTVMKESLEEKEGEKEWEEMEEVDTAKEVWVAEGEARKENLVLPGGREATALYQVPSLFRSNIVATNQEGRLERLLRQEDYRRRHSLFTDVTTFQTSDVTNNLSSRIQLNELQVLKDLLESLLMEKPDEPLEGMR